MLFKPGLRRLCYFFIKQFLMRLEEIYPLKQHPQLFRRQFPGFRSVLRPGEPVIFQPLRILWIRWLSQKPVLFQYTAFSSFRSRLQNRKTLPLNGSCCIASCTMAVSPLAALRMSVVPGRRNNVTVLKLIIIAPIRAFP